jgi:hypothetical protein
MILLFLAWALLGGCSFLIGNAILNQLNPEHYFERSGDRLVVGIWLGILIFAIIFLGLSLLIPLTPLVGIVVAGISIFTSLLQKRNRVFVSKMVRSLSLTTVLGSCALALGIAAYTSKMVFLFDTGLYHFQLIKWLSQLGTVPGLALLHNRFGFTSSWFALAAPFNHGILQGRIAPMTGGFAMLLLLSHFSIAIIRVINQRAIYSDWFIVATTLLVLPVILEWGVAVSPSPDLPIIALVLLVSWVILVVSNDHEEGSRPANKDLNIQLLPLVLSAGAATIKLSAFPLLIVSGVFYLLISPPNIKKLVLATGVTSFFLLPFMVVSIVTTGCPLYPSPLLCTDLPWSLGAERALAITLNLIEWARWGGPTPAGATAFNWILPWNVGGTKYYFRSALLLLSFISLSFLFTSFVRRKGIYINKYAIAIGVTGITFMVLGSPALHYGLGYLAVLPGLLIGINFQLFNSLIERSGKLRKYAPVFLVSVLVCLVGIRYVIPNKDQKLLYGRDKDILYKAINEKRVQLDDNPYFNLILPPKLLNVLLIAEPITRETVDIQSMNITKNGAEDVKYFRPRIADELCWDSPLPCADSILKNVKLRNKEEGIKAGFVKG